MKRYIYVFATSLLSTILLFSPLANAETLKFHANLTAGAEVPPAVSNASGKADVTFDTNTKKLAWAIQCKDLTGDASAAHFHGPAKAGASAGPVIDISNSLEKGSATLTDEQSKQLQAGDWYVNVHTAKYPNGEIRGQVEKTQ
jgi:CHRD domain